MTPRQKKIADRAAREVEGLAAEVKEARRRLAARINKYLKWVEREFPAAGPGQDAATRPLIEILGNYGEKV